MLLNDIGKSPDATFRRINQHLETNYGFKISEDVCDKDLVAIMEQVEEEITDLKVKGDDARSSSEISKRLLVLEGLKKLHEYAIVQFQSRELEPLITEMIDTIADHFTKGGTNMADFDTAIEHAMREYRKSEYDFPNDYIEQRIRNGAMSKLQTDMAGSDPMAATEPQFPVMEDDSEDEAQGDSEMHGIEEDSRPFSSVSKRSGALGGHAAEMPDTPAARYAAKVLDNPALKLEPKGDEQVPMIRDKHGRMVPDPFAAQAAARRKGIVMKEHANLVKNLRRLLETEVSQAEVMMAAKGFAQELQEMVEKIGRLQNEDLPPVTDQMRETYGMESASAFQTQIYGALQSVMDALYTAKTQVDDAVGNMASTGQVGAETDMDMPVDGMDDMDTSGMDDMGADDDLDNIGADLDAEVGSEDEFGGEEALGRSKKMESAESLKRKVMEMQKLVAKARKLREAKK